MERTMIAEPFSIGSLLKRWRAQRHLSQLQLATLADVSSRHLCFVETGRSEPSRELVLRLALVLDLPLAERNALLVAAGYAPMYPRRAIESPAMGRVRAILNRILDKQEPYPAMVVLRDGQVFLANQAARRLLSFLGLSLPMGEGLGGVNLTLAVFDPAGLRPYFVDWEDVARAALRRLSRDAEALGGDSTLRELIATIMRMPGVPTDWQHISPCDAELPCLTFTLARGNDRLTWLSTITTFGTPQDVSLQGLSIESFFPADEATEQRWNEIGAQPSAVR